VSPISGDQRSMKKTFFKRARRPKFRKDLKVYGCTRFVRDRAVNKFFFEAPEIFVWITATDMSSGGGYSKSDITGAQAGGKLNLR
jgi:hypothetical protein